MYHSQHFNLWHVKNGQCDTEHQQSSGITEHFPQHDTVYELGVGHAGADEIQQKGNNHLYHTPEGGRGDDHAVFHRQTVEQFRTLLVNHVGHLPVNRLSLPLKHTSSFLADSDLACLLQGRDRFVQSGQNFREPAFKFLHPVAQNADGPVIVFQRVGQAVFLLHSFGCRECRVYF